MSSITPSAVNSKKTSICPSEVNRKTTTIQPREANKYYKGTIPKSISIPTKTVSQTSSAGITIAVLALVGILVWYIYSYVAFTDELTRTWERVEADDGTYYTLQLKISDDEIDYNFDAWLISSTIASYDYWCLAPGIIVVDQVYGKEIIKISIEEDMMIMTPALTSTDDKEYWFK